VFDDDELWLSTPRFRHAESRGSGDIARLIRYLIKDHRGEVPAARSGGGPVRHTGCTKSCRRTRCTGNAQPAEPSEQSSTLIGAPDADPL